LEIHISDTGCGIPPEAQKLIFDEFYQTGNPERSAAKGFGLGLAIVRRLAQQLGAEVTLESASGRGSRFSILFADAVAPAEPTALSASAAASGAA
jgi:signal transduction histidine kinase